MFLVLELLILITKYRKHHEDFSATVIWTKTCVEKGNKDSGFITFFCQACDHYCSVCPEMAWVKTFTTIEIAQSTFFIEDSTIKFKLSTNKDQK